MTIKVGSRVQRRGDSGYRGSVKSVNRHSSGGAPVYFVAWDNGSKSHVYGTTLVAIDESGPDQRTPARPADESEVRAMAAARLSKLVPLLVDAAFGTLTPLRARAALADMGIEL